MPTTTLQPGVLTTEALRQHWQGHRKLTRSTIDAFPEDQLFNYSIGGMRPFSALVAEFLGMAVPGLRGIATGEWATWKDASSATTKADLLALWDEATAAIDEIWPTVPEHRWNEMDQAFGQWPGTGTSFILYFLENEVHHRGQGYVYLRSLGIEPPPFTDHLRP